MIIRILKETGIIVVSSLLAFLCCILIFTFKDGIFASEEIIGTFLSTDNLRLESPNTISFHTNMSSTEGDSGAKMRMMIDKTGNIGIGTSAPTDAKLHLSGNIRTNTPTQSYHLATKQYVDTQMQGNTIATLSNCSWTSQRHYSDDENHPCSDFGSTYVQMGIDLIQDHDYMRYNRIFCCEISF